MQVSVQMDNPAQLLTQVGIMNKISTGNTVLDLLLCMLLPFLLQRLTPHFDKARLWWQVPYLECSSGQFCDTIHEWLELLSGAVSCHWALDAAAACMCCIGAGSSA